MKKTSLFGKKVEEPKVTDITIQKDVKDVVACVIDYGCYLYIAEKLADKYKKVFYLSPAESEYLDAKERSIGTGLDKVERLDNFLDPKYFDEIDLFIFPDRGFAGLQKHLRSLGKSVFGQFGLDVIETHRDKFLDVLKKVGLPTIKSERIVGLANLKEYLKDKKDKWIKINEFRNNFETSKFIDMAHSERMLDSLAVAFGGYADKVVFIVQDPIDTAMELGYDGWTVDGKFPSKSFQGYEKKNELYLGAVLDKEDLPEEIKVVNDKLSPLLKKYGYRDWWATEIRVGKDGKPYFIDSTPRCPGQTGEHQVESCENLAEVIWNGANGILIEPEFKWNFAAEATLHYTANCVDGAISEEWKSLTIPKKVEDMVKLYHYCKVDGVYQIVPRRNDEVGVVLGFGDSAEEAVKNLTKNLDMLKDLPLSCDLSGFADLVDEIQEAEKKGIKFSDKKVNKEAIIKAVI